VNLIFLLFLLCGLLHNELGIALNNTLTVNSLAGRGDEVDSVGSG
jgi:hypothetical protein